jgi:hypothetical protein
MLVRFAKSTHEPNLAAALLDKVADLKSKLDHCSLTNPKSTIETAAVGDSPTASIPGR